MFRYIWIFIILFFLFKNKNVGGDLIMESCMDWDERVLLGCLVDMRVIFLVVSEEVVGIVCRKRD